jgi:hypothetical protein
MTPPTATIVAGILGLVGVLLSVWANVKVRQTDRRTTEEVENFE